MLGVAFVSLWLTDQWLLRPDRHEVGEADAALVMVGGRGERVQAMSRLAANGGVDHLVVMAVDLPESNTFRRICDTGLSGSAELHCLSGRGDTRDEARRLSRYAERQGWDHVVVVTSSYHLSRSRLLVERCFDGRVDGLAATPDSSAAVWFGQVLHEWAGLVETQVRRGC
ncbi:MAG: ElyC/SanA/YdcF family protein [Actinomycetota bacterium]|nr:ElyC/SanA/YdcF family protein [Actinomycetota bacterium]